jgi:hypothetical protein
MSPTARQEHDVSSYQLRSLTAMDEPAGAPEHQMEESTVVLTLEVEAHGALPTERQ